MQHRLCATSTYACCVRACMRASPCRARCAMCAEAVVASGFKLPPKMAPLRTHPSVEVARGGEATLPHG